MSDSKKMPSPYVVLENRPLDQWKVTELKEELKRRKLITKGLKEDLVKRLDEAVRAEIAEANENLNNGFDDVAEPETHADDATMMPTVAEETIDTMEHSVGENESLGKDNVTEKLDIENSGDRDVKTETDRVQIDDGLQPLAERGVPEGEGGSVSAVEGIKVVEETSVETTVVVSEGVVSEELGEQKLQTVEIQEKGDVPNWQPENGEPKPDLQSPKEEAKPESSPKDEAKPESSSKEEAKPESTDPTSPVVEVSQVKSDSISIDTISITEKNELKDNVIADDVKLELDVKPEMVQPSFSNVVLDGGKSESVEIDEPHEDKVSAEDKDVNSAENVDICKKNDSGDLGSPEKLNLDRSSGDDSMEEDVLESKQIDSQFGSDEVGDRSENIEVPLVKEGDPADVMVEDVPADKSIASSDDKSSLAVAFAKRKFNDQEEVGKSETMKRQRRWNSDGLKVPEQQNSNRSTSTTPRDTFPTMKRSFSRSESTVSDEVPKERVVPPSSKPPTTSLRIDRFLRPFTLKAVQELLGKTGTVVSFWMDHIKTHCYVTYSSVEEAVETRNAVYNLQWPVNGGRLLLAEFVDPQEVKNRVEAPLLSPATPVSTAPTLPPPPPPPPAAVQPPQPSPRLQVQKQQLPPPPSLPPPPPLSNPPQARERALPPPPPLPEKVDPPIVTLDDLFRKTRATPRIYYLPLSDEQVAAKLKAHGKTAKQ